MSRIEESLYNSVSKYGVRVDESINKPSRRSRLTEDLIDDIVETSLLWSVDEDELDSGIKELEQNGIEVLDINQPDEDWFEFEIDIRGKKSDICDELIKDYGSKEDAEEFYPELFEGYTNRANTRRKIDAPVLRGFRFGNVRVGESCDLTEAVNPENEEVNAIIKKYLGKKGVPNKKEQAVLDKYGIKKDEYGGFVGPKGARIYADRTSVSGPSKPGRTTRSSWGDKYRSNSEPFGWFDKSKTGGKYKNPKDVDALDKIDYANYLTKVDPDEPRGKNKEWSVDAENEYSMKPYSEPYKNAKKDAKYERRRQQSEIDDILADEKEIERRQRSVERSKENAKKHAENAAKAEQDRKDILAKAREKHGKTNESMSLHEDRVLSDWEANLSKQDRFLYDGITNRLEDAIVAYMKFIRDVEGMTDSEVRNAAAVFLTTEAHNLDIV